MKFLVVASPPSIYHSRALSDFGKTVALAYEGNPTKSQDKKTLVTQLARMMEGWMKEDPPTKKTLLVQIDVPALLAELGMENIYH